MSDKEKNSPDPFPHLPRRGLYVEVPRTVYVQTKAGLFSTSEVGDMTRWDVPLDKAKAIDDLRVAVNEATKRGRGRPKSTEKKP